MNRCRGFCRPLPNHSATPPDHPSCRCERSVYPGMNGAPKRALLRDDGIRSRDPLSKVLGHEGTPHEPRRVSPVDLSAQR